MAKQWIALKPKWHPDTGDFFGYDQVDGTHFFDEADKVVEFVPKTEFDKIDKERAVNQQIAEHSVHALKCKVCAAKFIVI